MATYRRGGIDFLRQFNIVSGSSQGMFIMEIVRDGLFGSSSPYREARVRRVAVDGRDIVTYTFEKFTLQEKFQIPLLHGDDSYDPPLRDRRFALAVGETYRAESGVVAVRTSAGVAAPGSTDETVVTGGIVASVGLEVTYLGQETVTVPAGTFTACHFRQRVSGSALIAGTTEHQWLAKGTGIVVKTQTDSSPPVVTELVSGTGAPGGL